MSGHYIRPYLDGKKIKVAIDIVKNKDKYWHCEFKKGIIAIKEDKPLFFREKQDRDRLWKQVIIIFKHINDTKNHLTVFNEGGYVRKINLLPILVTRGETVGIDTKTHRLLTNDELMEEYPDEYESQGTPVYLIDEDFIVWNVNNFRVINELDYKKEQIEWIIKYCNSEIERLKKDTNKYPELKNEIELYEERIKELEKML